MTLDVPTKDAPQPSVPVTAPAGGLVVAVVAGTEVVRRGIDGLLRSVPEVVVVRTCADLDHAADLTMRERLDVIIVTATETGRLSAYADQFARGGTTVLILVDSTSIGELCGYPSGVGGFLWQPDLTAATLRDALRRCGTAEMPVPADLLRALLAQTDGPHRRSRSRQVNLTGRERETLVLLVGGLSNKEIAKRLSISSNGAKRLVASIMLKLDAPNRTAAAVTAVRAGIVESE